MYPLLHRLLLEGIGIEVESTLSLTFALPSPLAFASITFAALRRRVPITDTLIPLCKEFVHRDVIRIDVCFNLGKTPREEWIQFKQTCGVHFEGLECCSCSPLRRSSPGNNSL